MDADALWWYPGTEKSTTACGLVRRVLWRVGGGDRIPERQEGAAGVDVDGHNGSVEDELDVHVVLGFGEDVGGVERDTVKRKDMMARSFTSWCSEDSWPERYEAATKFVRG